MKKVYEIKEEAVSTDWGIHIGDRVVKRVYTDEATAQEIVEAYKADLEAHRGWWIGVGRGEDNRPNVWAEALEVEGL